MYLYAHVLYCEGEKHSFDPSEYNGGANNRGDGMFPYTCASFVYIHEEDMCVLGCLAFLRPCGGTNTRFQA